MIKYLLRVNRAVSWHYVMNVNSSLKCCFCCLSMKLNMKMMERFMRQIASVPKHCSIYHVS